MSEPTAPERLPLATDDPLCDRLAELRRLLPEAFAEGKLAPEKLAQLLGDGGLALGPERYGLNWAGKGDAIRALQAPSVGTLLPCRDQSVEFDATGNLIIEGDNLEVLKLLQRSYYGKVKLIYIDPPYNTGNEFNYPDNYSEGLQDYLKFSGQVSAGGVKLTTNAETDGRYHSKWRLVTVQNGLYEAVEFESQIEADFARQLDARKDIRLFFKLPDWFKIDTPLGTYNPDWAIVKEEADGKNKVYLVRETKSGPAWLDIPKPERDKIRCGKAHFSTLGVDYAWVTSASQV
jgi:hypothetical protein